MQCDATETFMITILIWKILFYKKMDVIYSDEHAIKMP